MGCLDHAQKVRVCAHCLRYFVSRAAGNRKYCSRRCFRMVDSKKRRAMYQELIRLGATRQQAQHCRYKSKFEELRKSLTERMQLG